MSKLIAPWHHKDHWILVVVDSYKGTAELIDSMPSRDPSAQEEVKKAVLDYCGRLGLDIREGQTFYSCPSQQSNRHDYGIYAAINAM